MINPFSGISSGTIFESLLYRALYLEYVKGKSIEVNGIEEYYSFLKEKTVKCSNFEEVYNSLELFKNKFKSLFSKSDSNSFLRPLSFFPDYRYRGELNSPVKMKADLKQIDEIYKGNAGNKIDSRTGDKEQNFEEKKRITSGYFYDEWNWQVQDYLENWCCLKEVYPKTEDKEGNTAEENYPNWQRLKRILEKIQPELMKKEKDLLFGDNILIDSLIRYLVEKKSGFTPPPAVYSKLYKNERDAAVLLLLDVSSSTGQEIEEINILKQEKTAVFMLAEIFEILGDKFGIYGFSGRGRQHCKYYLYKSFAEEWGERQQQRINNIEPRTSTRMGAALRHSLNKINKVKAKTKFIFLITDGKPQDEGYSSEKDYAQYDVRKACLEAENKGVKVFGLTMGDKSQQNFLNKLAIMFPHNHYLIINKLDDLPLYLNRLLRKFS